VAERLLDLLLGPFRARKVLVVDDVLADPLLAPVAGAAEEAAIEAAITRLRPILMTSFAFILGVVPLVVAKGAGAEMRVALGVAVFSGMLGVTVFGIFFTPVFFEPYMLGSTGARLVMLNPLSSILEGIRLVVVEGHNLLLPLNGTGASSSMVVWEPRYLAYSAVMALGGLIVSALIFHRAEDSFPEYL
jgi:ABC-type polysaccharide/polyol phosphate export permease